MAFNVSTMTNQGKTIHMSGSFNLASSEELHRDLFETIVPGDEIVFDLSEIQDISGAAIRMMLRLQRDITEQGGKFTVIGLTEEVEEILFLTGFLEHLNVGLVA